MLKKSLHPFFLSKKKRMMVSTALRYLADQLYDFIRRLYSFKFLRIHWPIVLEVHVSLYPVVTNNTFK